MQRFSQFFAEHFVLYEKARSTSSGKQTWGEPSKGEDIDEFIDNKLKPIAEKDKKDYDRILQKIASSVKDAKVMLAPIKPKSSIKSKLTRSHRTMSTLHDVVRGSIIYKNPEDLEKIKKMVRKSFKIYDEEEKKKGGDTDFGYYGSTHFDVELPSGNIAEIQIMSRSLKNVKGAAHDIYNQEREKVKTDSKYANSDAFNKKKGTSKAIFDRGSGNKRRAVRYGPNITSS